MQDRDYCSSKSAKTIRDWLAISANTYGKKTAISSVDERPSLSYQALFEQTQTIANQISAIGLKPGDIIAIALENGSDLLTSTLSIASMATALLLNRDQPEVEFERYFSQLDIKAVIVRHNSNSPIVALASSKNIPILELSSDSTTSAGQFTLTTVEPITTTSQPVFPQLDDYAILVGTSGSTGQPKIISLTHESFFVSINHAADWMHLTECDRSLVITPLTFLHALVRSSCPLLTRGGEVVCTPGYNPAKILDWLERYQPSFFTGVPSMYRSLLQCIENAGGISGQKSLRFLVTGSDKIEATEIKQVEAALGVPLIQFYGMSEVSPLPAIKPLPPEKCEAGAVGKVNPVWEIACVDEDGNHLPIGKEGEIILKGGYINRLISKNNSAVQNIRNGWFYTGDLGYLDENDFLYYTGRVDNRINRGGKKVYAGEIEAVLDAHSEIKQSAVFGIPDELYGECIGAVVVLHQDSSLTAKLIRQFVAQRAAEFKVPDYILIEDVLPLNQSGKVKRKTLAAHFGLNNIFAHKQETTIKARTSYTAPGTEIEQSLAQIWQNLFKLDSVSINDNFFELGGHSLLATQLISRFQQVFSVEISLQHLFENPTIATLAQTIAQNQNQGAKLNISQYQIITPRQNRDNAPLSFAQQQLWFLDQLEPNSSLYNILRAVRLNGNLNRQILKQALDAIVAHHETIRTNYISEDGKPIQVIASPQSVELQVIDLQQYEQAELETQVQRLLQQENQRPFNLASDLMLRGCLLQLAPQEHILVLVMHHIASDGWSMGILSKQLSKLYKAFSEGKSNPLEKLPIQYADYAFWQRERLSGEILDQQLNYWQQQLAGANPVLELPTDRPRPPVQTYRGASQSLTLPQSLSDKLKHFCQQEGVTLYMTLLAAFQTLLYRYSGQPDIIVGSPIAGRNRTEIEGLIGFFINTLVLRADLSGNPSFQELLGRVRSTTLDAYAHQDLPFEKLVEELNPERSLSHNPLFQVFFNMLNFEETQLELPGLKTELISVGETTTSKFDLTLYVAEQEDKIKLTLVYNIDLFALERMVEMLNQYHHLLGQIIENLEVRICDLVMVTPQVELLLPHPKQKLLRKWKGSVQSKFSQQAQRVPQHLAVADAQVFWTYSELEERANQLANYLIANNIKQQDIVAIYSQRSASLIWAILGILKAGAAFVILDPAYPTSRLIHCLGIAQPRAWLQITADELPTELQEYMDSLSCDCRLHLAQSSIKAISNLLEDYPTNLPEITVEPDDLAYVAFTSGSTGKPKGILGTHRPLSHFVQWHCQTFGLNQSDRFSMLSGLSHDPLLRDIFTPLSLGATIYIPEQQDIHTPHKLADWIRQQQISIAHITPAMAQLLTISITITTKDLRYVFFGGDILTAKDVNKICNFAPTATCVNFYGATETPQAMGYFVISKEGNYSLPKDTVPLGQGIEDVQLLLLNTKQQLAGIGELAEIYIRTPYLAKGYIENDEPTDEKFIINPFTQIADDRLYKTGDLGRYLPNGNIEYLGRIDHQVKIRGFRIELGEIETVLTQHPDISETVVIAREDIPGDKRLVAYVVPRQEQPHSSNLRSFLKELLPSYMVPSAFVFLNTMPLTPNGKIDRRALPVPDHSNQETSKTFVAPQDKLESHLIEIWSQVLNIQPIGVRDNFFDLGGNSLQAVALFAQIEQQFGKKLPLATLFQSGTVAEIAQIIRQEKWLAPWESLVPIQPNGSKPPLFYIHAGGGNLLVYRDLVLALGEDQPVYGLQPKGLDGKYAPFNRIEDMAAYYLAQIRKLQPNGPYFLAGLSSGGKTAWEIAQILQSQGEKVALLALFDTYGPDWRRLLPPIPRLLSVLKSVISNLLNRLTLLPQKLVFKLKQSGTKQTSTKVLENLGIIKKVLNEDQKINREKMQRNFDVRLAKYKNNISNISFWERWINSLAIFLLKHFAGGYYTNAFVGGLANSYITDDISEIPEALQQVQKANIEANKNYTPSVYSGQVILFRASERPPGFYFDPQLGWGDLAAGGMEIYEIPGNHTSIMKSPMLAEQLRICLEKAQANCNGLKL